MLAIIPWISLLISGGSLTVAIWTFIKQNSEEKRYSEKARKVIGNSITLAQYDILILITKIKNKKERIEDYKFQVKSLKRNLETVKAINISRLPNDASMNFQVYINDLEGFIYRISDGLNQLEAEQNKTQNFIFPFEKMMDSYSELFKRLGEKKKSLEENKNLFEDSEYKDNFDKIYEENKVRIEEGYQRMLDKEKRRIY